MVRASLALVILAVIAASGCKSDSGGSAAPSAQTDPLADRKVQAIEPYDMSQEAGRKPVFRWKLPSAFRSPNIVTFKLLEIGLAEDPRKASEQARQIALVTGLAGESPTELDLFKPPSAAVLTGEVCDMPQLAPNRWYCWKLRVVSDLGSADANFFFRTRPDEAAPGAKP
ncbi:MAG: hypothetical protein NT049_16445 [Planctomycetota bacterium]|nr:hypothetical protein [Planctomycetota bacterium]